MKATPKKAEPVRPRWPTFKELTDAYDRQAKLKRARIRCPISPGWLKVALSAHPFSDQ